MSRFLDLKDKRTANLFADGAGAVVLGAGSEPGFLASQFLARGEYHDALGIYTGGAFRPCTPENLGDVRPAARPVCQKVPQDLQHRILAPPDPGRAGQGWADGERRLPLSLHPNSTCAPLS
jgi:3-oxoacyl-[acyl-carrier-protein] synthase III